MNEQLRTIGELIEYLNQFDKDTIISAEYARMFDEFVIDYEIRPLLKELFVDNGHKEILMKRLIY